MFRFLRPRLLLLALPMIVLVMSSLGSNRGLADSQSPEACHNYLNDADLASRFTKPLYVPVDLKSNFRNATDPPMYVLEALEYIWRPAAGVCITKWGYDGATPGPTIRTAPKDQVQLLVYNKLPGVIYNPYLDPTSPLSNRLPPPSTAKYSLFGLNPAPPPAPFDRRPYAQSLYEQDPQLTLHLHGGHQVPTYDGDPMDTFPPGRSKMYVYPNNEDASTLWYHDHDMDHTRAHVLMGLAGFYLIEDRSADEQLGLPTGEFDIPIMFQRIPTELLDQPKTPDRPIWTVNNTLAPYYEVTNRPYRFRFLNGNDETPLNIFIADTKDAATASRQVALQQVGTDGGFMNLVSQKQALRLFPAERGDVVLDFSGITTETTIYLQAAAADAFKNDPTDKTAQSIVEFRVKPTLRNPPKFNPKGGILLPGDQQITKLTEAGAKKRTFYLDFPSVDASPAFATINGQFYDEHRIDASPELGATEIWTFVNRTNGYHPMHIHDIEFQVISRTNEYNLPDHMEPGDWGSGNLAWKDVFVVPPHEQVSIIGRFDDNLGVYVFHCHNLDHEDGGMMGQFQVVEKGAPLVPIPPKSHMGH